MKYNVTVFAKKSNNIIKFLIQIMDQLWQYKMLIILIVYWFLQVLCKNNNIYKRVSWVIIMTIGNA